MPAPLAVDLLPAEAELLSGIAFTVDRLEPAEVRANGARVRALMRLLIYREAIPAVRRAHFTDAKHNIGFQCSHMEIFERNGTRGETIFEHPNFLDVLRYFLYGPNLPARVVAEFQEVVSECGTITSGDYKVLVSTAKRLARDHARDYKVFADEFYKLALEVGAEPHARTIRDAVYKLAY